MCHESRCSQMLVLMWVPVCVCCEAVVPRLPLKKTELPNELLLWAANAHPSSSICFSKPPLSSTHSSKTQLPLFYPSLIHFNIKSNYIYSSWTCVSDSGTVCHFHVLMSPISFFHPQNVFFDLLIYLLCNLFIVFHYTGLKFPILLSKIHFILVYIFICIKYCL